MTLDELEALFADEDLEEFLKFERVKDPPSKRPDLCAFILLDRLVPGDRDIVAASEHDEFFLAVDCDELAKVATRDDVITLIRCGVRYSEECLCMFS